MATQHTYRSAIPPGIQLDEGIRSFFETFYKTSDTPDAHDAYADSFTEDADFVMASKKARGRDGEFCIFIFERDFGALGLWGFGG